MNALFVVSGERVVTLLEKPRRCADCGRHSLIVVSRAGHTVCSGCDAKAYPPKPSCGVDGCTCGDILNHGIGDRGADW